MGVEATVHDTKRATTAEYSAEVKGAIEMERIEDLACSERILHTIFKIFRISLLRLTLIFLHKPLDIYILVRLR